MTLKKRIRLHGMKMTAKQVSKKTPNVHFLIISHWNFQYVYETYTQTHTYMYAHTHTGTRTRTHKHKAYQANEIEVISWQ